MTTPASNRGIEGVAGLGLCRLATFSGRKLSECKWGPQPEQICAPSLTFGTRALGPVAMPIERTDDVVRNATILLVQPASQYPELLDMALAGPPSPLSMKEGRSAHARADIRPLPS